MYNPTLQALLIQARVEELHRASRTFALQRTAAEASSETRHARMTPLSTFLKRAIERVGARAAHDTREDAMAVHGWEILAHGSSATRSQRS